jgi:hypothetical protein
MSFAGSPERRKAPRTAMQKASFWSWRACLRVGRILQLGVIGLVLFIAVNAVADMLHRPIIADRAPPQHFMPAAHAK